MSLHNPKDHSNRNLAIMWCIAVAILMIVGHALAFDNGQYGDVPDNIRSWFKSVRSPNGVPCCDIADGHSTTWDKHPGDDRYWVPINGEWIPVPPEAVVYNAGNPTGEAVVWYVPLPVDMRSPDHREYYIRCFVPGGGV